MKKLLVLIFAALTAANVYAQSVVASGNCGVEGDGSNLTWQLTDDGTLTISGTGDMEDFEKANSL